MSTPLEVREARIKIWDQMPKEIVAISQRTDILQPAGNALFAEGMTREFAELIWKFMLDLDKGELEESFVRASLVVILEHYAKRLAGFCALHEAAAIIRKVKDSIAGCSREEFEEMMAELRLYLTRLNSWLDLLLPWHETNEAMRARQTP